MLLSQIPVSISVGQVLRSLGKRDESLDMHGSLDETFKQTLSMGRLLLCPSATWGNFSNSTEGHFNSESRTVARLSQFTGFDNISVIAVTVGDNITKKVEQLFDLGKPTEAVILDAVGTVAVEEAAGWITNMLGTMQRKKGLFPKTYVPGCSDLKISILPELIPLVNGEKIKISCDQYYQLNPVKSKVFILGWVTEKELCYLNKCKGCQKADCLHREIPYGGRE